MAITLSIISFSKNGYALSKRIEGMAWTVCRPFSMWKDMPEGDIVLPVSDLSQWTKEQFEAHHAILFIGACGIAVRSIAPLLENKLTDPPVLVMDEGGKYVIPILSGHVGGANAMARELAQQLGAEAVITTATDVNRKFAVDVFAAEHGFAIHNKDGIKEISARVLNGESVTVAVDGMSQRQCRDFLEKKLRVCPAELVPVGTAPAVGTAPKECIREKPDIFISEAKPIDCLLWLKPKPYILGMGCRRGKQASELLGFVRDQLAQLAVSEEEVYALASIDRKQDEEGLVDLADQLHIPFCVYSAKVLAQLSGEFCTSAFVEEQVGVDNVCERAALACCGEKGKLILKKTAGDGMTLAVAERDWRA